jgi:hypothetical protein
VTGLLLTLTPPALLYAAARLFFAVRQAGDDLPALTHTTPGDDQDQAW